MQNRDFITEQMYAYFTRLIAYQKNILHYCCQGFYLEPRYGFLLDHRYS